MRIAQDTKIGIMIVVLAAFLLEANSALEFIITRRSFNNQLSEMLQRDLTGAQRVAEVRTKVEATVKEYLPKVEKLTNAHKIDALKEVFEDMVEQNDHVMGVSMVYVPERLPKHLDVADTQRYGIYVFETREDGKELTVKTLENFDYTKRSWYKEVFQKADNWSEPYKSIYVGMLVCSFAQPLRDAKGNIVAVVEADTPLWELSQMATQFYENQHRSFLRKLLFHLLGMVLLGFLVWLTIGYLRRLNIANADKERISNELKLAHNIQQSMIPKPVMGSTERDGVDLYASLTPARAVGGDFYDYLMGSGYLFFCIGDVTGKGIPAALLMTVMRTLFNTEARNVIRHPIGDGVGSNAAAIVGRMNRATCEEQTSGYFATMFVGVLDLKTGLLDYCNAGHEAPVLLKSGTVEGDEGEATYLDVIPNLPVGALIDWNYKSQRVQLHKGDTLFLYTDGLSEARNAQDELFTRKRVLGLSQHLVGLSPHEIVERMEKEAYQHVGEAEQSDDLTLLAVQWKDAANGNASSLAPSVLSKVTLARTGGAPTTFANSVTADAITLRAADADLTLMKTFIFDVSQRAGLSKHHTRQVRLAVEEAVANVINHSRADLLTLSADIRDDELALSVIDNGDPFDPTTADVVDTSIPADERPPGGLGIILIRKMSDGLSYTRDGHLNILTIKKKINAEES